MKAFILAAGIGSRLRPLTDTMPKALVPVAGTPILQHIILKLKSSGFDQILVNVHHFPDQIVDFLKANDNFGINISISDERALLLDTGGALLHAKSFFDYTNSPVLVHNVDILSNCDLQELMAHHTASHANATMLVSHRNSSRQLVFTNDTPHRLAGWINNTTGDTKPAGFVYDSGIHTQYAYSGIQVVSPAVVGHMAQSGISGPFSVIDYYTTNATALNIHGYEAPGLQLLDIGKPDTLNQADRFISNIM